MNDEMTSNFDTQGEWWQVVQAIATHFTSTFSLPERFTQKAFVSAVASLGYTDAAVKKACEWLETVSLTHNLPKLMAFLVEDYGVARVSDREEMAHLSLNVQTQLARCRSSYLMPRDFTEKLIEWMRGPEARDWEEKDYSIFFIDAIIACNPGITFNQAKALLFDEPKSAYF